MSHLNPLRVLFICTHNSARSILSEALLNHMALGRCVAYSAGSSPRANQTPHPLALSVLEQAGITTVGLRSKSWDEFSQVGATPMDLVITVCDNAAGEICPLWQGSPAKLHWGFADPSATEGTAAQQIAAFNRTMNLIKARLEAFLNLPMWLDETLLMRDPSSLQAQLNTLARQ